MAKIKHRARPLHTAPGMRRWLRRQNYLARTKESNYIDFLSFIVETLHERGLAAKALYLAERESKGLEGSKFGDGYLLAYYHCLDTLLNQVEAWGLPMDQINPNIDIKDLHV